MSVSVRKFGSRVSRGFTLLELIIVLVVLAALAALVIPTLGFVRDQAKYATAAAGAAEVLNNLELYKSANGTYPARLDSLVNTSGTVFTKGYVTTGGAFPLGTITSGSTNFIYYYMTNGGLPSTVDHLETASDPNESTASSAVVTPSATSKYAIIDPLTADADYKSKARRLTLTAYPNQTDAANPTAPTGHTLVALGVGSRAASVGTTMTTAPTWPGGTTGKYSRYVALFDVTSGPTGRGKVTLKAVVDTEFETIASNVKNYRASAPIDDQGSYSAP